MFADSEIPTYSDVFNMVTAMHGVGLFIMK